MDFCSLDFLGVLKRRFSPIFWPPNQEHGFSREKLAFLFETRCGLYIKVNESWRYFPGDSM